jgi:hypothetical protein
LNFQKQMIQGLAVSVARSENFGFDFFLNITFDYKQKLQNKINRKKIL